MIISIWENGMWVTEAPTPWGLLTFQSTQHLLFGTCEQYLNWDIKTTTNKKTFLSKPQTRLYPKIFWGELFAKFSDRISPPIS